MTTNRALKQALVKQLARYKAESGRTYEDISKELGSSVPTIYSWISKGNLPTEGSIDQIKIFLASKGMTTPTARLSDATTTELLKGLRSMKERSNLNYKEMAELIGISKKSVEAWFRGITTPTALNAYHVQNFLAGREKQTNLFEELFTYQVSQSETSLTAEDDTQYISSREVAKWTEKRHSQILRDIERLISYLADEGCSPSLRIESYFVEDSYQVEEGGRFYKFYWCSPKGCEMIANKMTGKKGVHFTAHCIEYFHATEHALKETPTTNQTITEPTPQPTASSQSDTTPELTYIRSKLSDMMELTDLQDIYSKLWGLSNFVAMVKTPSTGTKEVNPNLGVK